MNKKIIIGFIAVYVLINVLDYLIHGMILASTYESEAIKTVFRPDAKDMQWIYPVIRIFFAFFFVFIFSKGWEGRGIMEGVRYGLYIGLMVEIPNAYGQFAAYAIPYSLAMQWWVYGIVEYIIAGIVLTFVFGKKESIPA